MEFKAPSVNQVADFLLHLFQERKLQPPAIDGYQTAITDKVGNSSIEISKDENLSQLPDSIHRDRPKGQVHQVKAHVVRAVAACKAFQGVSLD